MAGFAPEVIKALETVGVGGAMPHGGPVGNVWYVNGGADGITAGVNALGRGGKDRPFLTIEYAIAQCINDNDDYIICWNTYNQDTFPITMTRDSVHVIGVAGPDGSWPVLDASSQGIDGGPAAFDFGVGIENCEIAGFSLSGGGTGPCIDIPSGANMTWIHHCTFGHDWFGGARDGIRFLELGGSIRNVIIEDCWFLGDTFGSGTLTSHGIIQTGGAMVGCTIRRNYFIGLVDGAIRLGINADGAGASQGHVICDNYTGCGQDLVGNAIYLGENSFGCLVAHNEANQGRDKMVANSYEDIAAGGANDNHWMSNQHGLVMVYPHVAV